MVKFAINGFGRIGRVALRAWYLHARERLALGAINTSGSLDLEGWLHLLKYDTAYGRFPGNLAAEPHQPAKEATDDDPLLGYFLIDGVKVPVLAQRDPAKLPWKTLGIDMVIESTGVFLTSELAGKHLESGAKKVVLSAPPKDDSLPIQVLSVNQVAGNIISNASCTTNSIAPVVAVLEEALGIRKALLTTIHAYTDDQNLQDGSHRDLRRARAAASNIVPTSTGAAVAAAATVPSLKGKFDGLALRVPVITGSISDITMLVSRPTSETEVNEVLTRASRSTRWQGILAVTNEPLVSSDVIGRPESSLVDLGLTRVIEGDLVKVVAWYDNEFAYASRLVDTLLAI